MFFMTDSLVQQLLMVGHVAQASQSPSFICNIKCVQVGRSLSGYEVNPELPAVMSH